MPDATEGVEATVKKLRVGVVGAGVIGQVMHLHFLRELDDRFEIAAVCDLSPSTGAGVAEHYHVPHVFTDWRAMLTEPLDAVFVLTSGSHAPIAIAAAKAGLHVFAEKPMCVSTAEGLEMIAAAREAHVVLMIGYPKRYDPAFARFLDEATRLHDVKLLRVTTTESPFLPYVRHYPLLLPASDVSRELLNALGEESTERLVAAIGTSDPYFVRQYSTVLLDTLVHEINTTRAVLGEPESLDYVDLSDGHATVILGFGGPSAVVHWLDTPEMTRYSMEFSLHAANGRATLSFPSPYLRNAPTSLVVERGDAATVETSRVEELTSYESGFKEELRVFYDAVTSAATVPTSGEDALRDIALCQAIIRSARDGVAVKDPTSW